MAVNAAPRVKRAAVINDVSGVGRCSLTVMLPVMSVLGVQACPAVTGLLSAHTMFDNVAVLDTTGFLGEVFASWNGMGLTFDAVICGYLASARQGGLVRSFFEAHKEALRFVDPAMADHGRLYAGLGEAHVEMMRGLCAMADAATPNLSEYALITGEEYSAAPRTDEQIERMLLGFPGRAVVIKGVPVKGGYVNACRDFSGEISVHPIRMLDCAYPGTGDIFAAVLFSKILGGETIGAGVEAAVEFVRRGLELSLERGGDVRHGVLIEAALPLLTDRGRK